MSFDLKICGLKTSEVVSAVLDGGATHIGFIFFPKSPRHISVEDAGRLRLSAQGRAQVVAVTVDADDEYIAQIVEQVRPDILQLHGHETPERVMALKTRYGLPVIKAFAIRNFDDLMAITAYKGIADRFLFDAKPPKGSNLPGGNGVSFDWDLLTKLDDDVDYMLSGGLNADNVAQALAQTGAKAIDVSSGVEAQAGVKDVRLINEFLQAVRDARTLQNAPKKA
ncbi:phosphoribosylanthranilate isomerase [Brucellaceae bacterium C25G]